LDEVGKSRSLIFSTFDLTSGFLLARQGSQVPVEGHADGIAGLAGVVCKTYVFRHDGGERHHHIY
jgi:hypothetical protein